MRPVSGKFAALDFQIRFLLFVSYTGPYLALLGNVPALLKSQPVYDIIVAYTWIACYEYTPGNLECNIWESLCNFCILY